MERKMAKEKTHKKEVKKPSKKVKAKLDKKKK
jgi:hypothetical protein